MHISRGVTVSCFILDCCSYRSLRNLGHFQTHVVDANDPFWSVCVEVRTENGSRSGPSSRGAQRRDASCPPVIFLIWPKHPYRVLACSHQGGGCSRRAADVSRAGTCVPPARRYKYVSPTTMTCHHNKEHHNEHHARASSS
jgi:hypothetical protein